VDDPHGAARREGNVARAHRRRGGVPGHQELFWTYLLGWQRVALGLLIVAVAVFFPSGIVGFVRDRLSGRRKSEESVPAKEKRVTAMLGFVEITKSFDGIAPTTK
jgi:hypothetical protein